MKLAKWLEQVERELKRAGIGRLQRARLLGELRDHWMDCLAEERGSKGEPGASGLRHGGKMMATESLDLERKVEDRIAERVGRPEVIAQAALQHPPQRSWLARHPWLLVAAALPLWVLGLVGYGMSVAGIAQLWDFRSHLESGTLPWWGRAVVYGAIYVPVGLAVACVTWAAVRSRVATLWYLAALALPLLVALHTHVALKLSREVGQSSVALGIAFPPDPTGIFQFLIPAAFAAALWFGLRRRSAPLAGNG